MMLYKPFIDVNGGLRKSELYKKHITLAAGKKDLSKEPTKSDNRIWAYPQVSGFINKALWIIYK